MFERYGPLKPDSFWHATKKDDFLIHNARLNGGWTYSVSAIAIGDLEGATTPYTAAALNADREDRWEAVRREHYYNLPSRRKAFFAFRSPGEADALTKGWFANEDRLILEVRIPELTKIHIADARHLDAPPEAWEASAALYWEGEPTGHPSWEVIIHGAFFLPDVANSLPTT